MSLSKKKKGLVKVTDDVFAYSFPKALLINVFWLNDSMSSGTSGAHFHEYIEENNSRDKKKYLYV